jgi:hypothetical protein
MIDSEPAEQLELAEQLLCLLRQAHKESDEGEGSGPARTTSVLASAVGQPKERVQARLEALKVEGKVKEPADPVRPNTWMIVLPSN